MIYIIYTIVFADGFSNYPWKDILTSMPMWSITCAHFCENWGFYTLLTQLPSFMNGNYKILNVYISMKKKTNLSCHIIDVLKFDIGKGSLVSALPYLVMSIILQISGFFVDWLRKKKILTTTQVRIWFTYTHAYKLTSSLNVRRQVRKLFNCGAFVSQTVFMYLAANSTTEVGSIFCLTMAVGLGAFAWSGFRYRV